MNLFLILGNQLFPLKYLKEFKKNNIFYMAEDYELCTFQKHHKQKILLFLSSMRSYADTLKKNKYKIGDLFLLIQDVENAEKYLLLSIERYNQSKIKKQLLMADPLLSLQSV